MTIAYATSLNFLDTIAHNTVLLAFSSTWCEPCKMIHSALEEIDNEMSDTINIVVIDLEENQDIAKSFDIIGTPTLILFKEGEILGKVTGYQPKEMITNFIRKYI